MIIAKPLTMEDLMAVMFQVLFVSLGFQFKETIKLNTVRMTHWTIQEILLSIFPPRNHLQEEVQEPTYLLW